VNPSASNTFPYRYTVAGRLALPAGVAAATGCHGYVTVSVRRGNETVGTARAAVNPGNCTWAVAVKLSVRKRVPGHGQLRISPSFGGNDALTPFTGAPLTVQYG
jgi:hypothetical protein